MNITVKSTPAQAAHLGLRQNSGAILLDIRTRQELSLDGVPDVDRLVSVCWNRDGSGVEEFIAEILRQGVSRNDEIYVLCAAGLRSLAASQSLIAAGFLNITNICDGYWGARSNGGQAEQPSMRVLRLGGWRSGGLPWRK